MRYSHPTKRNYSGDELYRNRLALWQVCLANPVDQLYVLRSHDRYAQIGNNPRDQSQDGEGREEEPHITFFLEQGSPGGERQSESHDEHHELETISAIVPLTRHFRVGIEAGPIFVGSSTHGIIICIAERVFRIGRDGLLELFRVTVLIISRSRNNLEKPENKGAGVRPHPCFRGSFGRWFIFREVLIISNAGVAYSSP